MYLKYKSLALNRSSTPLATAGLIADSCREGAEWLFREIRFRLEKSQKSFRVVVYGNIQITHKH